MLFGHFVASSDYPHFTFQSVVIVYPTDGATPKDHLVLCQCASLVSEDIGYLTEVLVNIEGSTLKGPISGCIVHFLVPVKEVHLYELYNLHGDVKRNGDDHLGGGEEGRRGGGEEGRRGGGEEGRRGGGEEGRRGGGRRKEGRRKEEGWGWRRGGGEEGKREEGRRGGGEEGRRGGGEEGRRGGGEEGRRGRGEEEG